MYTVYPVPCILYTSIQVYIYACIQVYIYKFTGLQVYKYTSNVCIHSFESFDLLPRAWGPLPCRPVPCEPLPRVPGASPWGGSRHQSTRFKVSYAHLFFAYKFSSILMSVLGPLGVDLGSMLGVHFAPFGALAGLYWSQTRLRSVLISKT